jgi:hypothetical protein
VTVQGNLASLNNGLAMLRYVAEFINIALSDGIITFVPNFVKIGQVIENLKFR